MKKVAKKKAEPDSSTEDKIKEAARRVFIKKGYSATRTRDIAEEAGINLALLNYYFRSKEKLFDLIMFEKVQKLFGVLGKVANNPDTSLTEKIEAIASLYVDLLLVNPDLPIFVLSELRSRPEHFEKLVQKTNILRDSVLLAQLQEKRPDVNPLQFIPTILGIAIYPFIMRPILQSSVGMSDKQFTTMMVERKTLVPAWIKAILKAK
ncbi:MAG TPA: TetR/AcrR family transcriptional regulator [Chryseolinea sp.]|nr:TetR/AcrR family transcriptional regulator [Chryseolinea sp.]